MQTKTNKKHLQSFKYLAASCALNVTGSKVIDWILDFNSFSRGTKCMYDMIRQGEGGAENK